MRITAWDIEASNLSADFGICLCVGFKDVEKGSTKVLNVLDYVDDSGDLIKAEKRLLRDVSIRLLEADVWLTHFGTWYDIPFVNSRLIYHQLPILPTNFAHVDTWKISKNHLKLRNNRLITISEHLGTKDEKNAIKPEQWIRALGGHRPSMNYIVNHCKRDVLVLEQSYLRLRPLLNNHPNRKFYDERAGCPTCGSRNVQRRGYHRTAAKEFPRVQCQNCGRWSHMAKPSRTLSTTFR